MSTASIAHITEFINAVNSEFLKGKKLDELTALWKRISTVPKCPALVKAGIREGQACGKSCVKGQEFCLCHIPREPVAPRNECTFVLKAGKRQGHPCNKACPVGETICVSHERVNVPCAFLLRSGERMGQPCGMTCAEGTICKKHARLASVSVSTSSDVVSATSSDSSVGTSESDSTTEVESPIAPPPTPSVSESIVDAAPVVSESPSVVSAAPVVSEKVCGSILKSGPNKGKTCGKVCASGIATCATHK